MGDSFPKFKYYPYPMKTGSIKLSNERCDCCKISRGYIYGGPLYTSSTELKNLCPWCIHGGNAHSEYDVSFVSNFSGPISQSTIEEISFRTPGFSTFQEPIWLTCCNDACAFLGDLPFHEVKGFTELFESVKVNCGFSEKDWIIFFDALKEGIHPIYTFKCLTCEKYHGYSDYT